MALEINTATDLYLLLLVRTWKNINQYGNNRVNICVDLSITGECARIHKGIGC
jgi:hypothetical protein